MLQFDPRQFDPRQFDPQKSYNLTPTIVPFQENPEKIWEMFFKKMRETNFSLTPPQYVSSFTPLPPSRST